MIAQAPIPPTLWFDTCSFTELRRSYPKPEFESVWKFVEQLLSSGRILSIDEVYIELEQQDDEVFQWVSQWNGNFIPLDDAIQIKAREILSEFPTLIDLRKGKSGADPFLIAVAAVRGGTIVSEENRSGGPPKVKIPDVALSLDVTCIKFLNVLRQEGYRSTA
jgi:hypothetical protein